MAPPAAKRRRLSEPSKAQSLNGEFQAVTTDGQDEADLNLAQIKPRGEARSSITSFASSAYNSSMLQLQIDELLSEVRPDYEKRMVSAETAIRKLKKIINDIPDRGPDSVRDLLPMSVSNP